jgi:hypothetical protein
MRFASTTCPYIIPPKARHRFLFFPFSAEIWQVIVLGQIAREIALSPCPWGYQIWEKRNQYPGIWVRIW